jgi:hypothetical protein
MHLLLSAFLHLGSCSCLFFGTSARIGQQAFTIGQEEDNREVLMEFPTKGCECLKERSKMVFLDRLSPFFVHSTYSLMFPEICLLLSIP